MIRVFQLEELQCGHMIRVYQLEELQCGRGYDTGFSTGRIAVWAGI